MADFESIFQPVNTCLESPATFYSTPIQNHILYAYGHMHCWAKVAIESWIFVARMEEEIETIVNPLDSHWPIRPIFLHQIQTHRHLSDYSVFWSKYSDEDYTMSHHNLLAGEYICPLSNNCNLLIRRQSNFVGVFFHNISCDAHLFFRVGVELEYTRQNKNTTTGGAEAHFILLEIELQWV